MKEIFFKTKILLATFSILLIFVIPQHQGIQAKSNTLRGDEALRLFERSEYFNSYKDKLVSSDPVISKVVTDENNNEIGWIAQYEINFENEYIETDKEINVEFIEKVSSLITFVYNDKDSKLEAYLIDYSEIVNDNNIYITDLVLNEKTNISLNDIENDELKKVKEEVIEDREELENKAIEQYENPESVSPQQVFTKCNWWICTKTESGGGVIAPKCAIVLGTACSFLGNSIKYSKLICNPAGIAISCYVPKYTICVKGYFETRFCPQQN